MMKGFGLNSNGSVNTTSPLSPFYSGNDYVSPVAQGPQLDGGMFLLWFFGISALALLFLWITRVE